MTEGIVLVRAGNYPAAILAFQHALTIAEASKTGYWELAKTLDSMGGAYADIGQLAESQRQFRRSLAVIESNEGRNSLAYAVVLASLSETFEEGRVGEETITILREAIRVHGATAGAMSMAILHDYLSHILMARRRYSEAETLLLDLRSNLAKQQAADPVLMCIALNNLGQLRYRQKRYGESVDLYLDSLRIGQATLGEQHPTLGTLLNNLAMSYFKMGRLDDAESVFQKANALCRQKLGENHPTCGEILSNYSLVLRKLGRKHEANRLERRCQQIEQASRRRNGVDSTINVSDLLSRGR